MDSLLAQLARKGKRAVARLEGRANAAEIDELVEEHFEGVESGSPETS